MKKFKTLEEMQPYLDEKTNTYNFIENGKRMDIEIDFDLTVSTSIDARNIDARNIDVLNINAWNINARNIDARNIDVLNINAWNINAWNINAQNIDVLNIDAWNIGANDINANNIDYYAICIAYQSFKCNSVKGQRRNAIHKCLDGDIEYVGTK